MVLSPAERQRRRRQKLRQDGIYTIYKAKNALYTRRHRERTKEGLKQLSPAQQNKLRDLKKQQATLRQRKYRQDKVTNMSSPITTPRVHVQAYSAKQSLHHAVNRVWCAFPRSPRKRASVMRKLSSGFCQPAVNDGRGRRVDSIHEELQAKVTHFYERDDISRVAPGKRDTVIVRDESGKQKLQKRHLTMTISEAYALFKEENTNAKIGRRKFADLRPPAVMLSSQTPANVCTCLYYQIMILALDGIHTVISSIPKYTSEFPATCVLSPESESCWFGECRHNACGFTHMYPVPENALMGKATKWMQWKEVNGHLAKCEVEGKVQDLYDYISSKAPKFLTHSFIKRKQAAKYETDKLEASANDSDVAVLQMDFAENYTCEAQDKVQAAHWNQTQVTLFTTVTWFRDAILSHVIVSDLLRHDKTSVSVFTDHILTCLPDGVKEVRVWTDGPASQFKNKFVMAAMKVLADQHNVQMMWNFSATSHGKGPVDGIGGTLKRMAAERVKNRQCIINNAYDFQKAVSGSSIEVTLISREEIQNPENERKLATIFAGAEPIKGIADFHFIQHAKQELITKRYGSEMTTVTDPNRIVDENDPTSATENAEESTVAGASSTAKPNEPADRFFHHPIIQDNWYGVYWEELDYWFVGRVLEVQGSKVKMEFIHQSSQEANSFKLANDVAIMATSQIFTPVQPPVPISSSRCNSLKLSDLDFKLVRDKYREFCKFTMQ